MHLHLDCWEEETVQYSTVEIPQIKADTQERVCVAPEQRSCLNCVKNLAWANSDGWANCGPYITQGLPEQRVNPDRARYCSCFKPIVN